MTNAAIIIPVFNPKQKYLDNIVKNYHQVPVLLVNNGNKIDIKPDKNIKIIKPASNLGFSGGVNMGIRELLKDNKIKWFLVLNQDLEMDNTSLNKFCNILQSKTPGIYGPFTGNFDPKRYTTIIDESVNQKSVNIDFVSGSCMALHREVVEKIGLFYEPYFMYYEDADICVRAKKAGFPVEKIDFGNIHHYRQQMVGTNSFAHQYYLARNHLLFMKRNAPASIILYEVLRMPLSLAEHYQKWEKGAQQGILDFALNKFGPYIH